MAHQVFVGLSQNPRELMGRSESRRHLLMHIPPPPTDDKGRLLPNASEQPSVAGVHLPLPKKITDARGHPS
ncbi:unnamed protein product [Musa acuminata subsp. burmannicoides]